MLLMFIILLYIQYSGILILHFEKKNPVNITAGEFRIARGKLTPAIRVKRRRYFWDAEFYPRRVVNRRR